MTPRLPAAVAVRESMRAHNQSAVFQVVHRHGPISRADIAAHLHLSPAAITSIASELIDRNLLFEAGTAGTGGVGRRAVLLEVDYDHALVAGVKLSRGRLVTALTNLNAEIRRTEERPLEDTSVPAVIDALEAALRDLQGADRVAAVGVSLPGIVDADRSTVRHSPLLGWDHVPLGRMLEERLGFSVIVENDVDALALAEAWFGHGRDHEDLLVVTLGRGVGLGILLNGDVYRGPRGGAGEFGHIILDPGGPASRYARSGSFEAYLSDDALLRDARGTVAALPDDADIDALAALAAQGDPDACALYERAGTVLGRALAILVNIFAPALIVLGGEGMRSADHLLPAARSELSRVAFGDLGDRVELALDAWGDDAWARGAAGLAASRYLVDVAMHPGGDRPRS